MFKPLEGVKVVDLTYFAAGPGTAKILADWGADVIKVEPSFGDPARKQGITLGTPSTEECNPFYNLYNANKRGLSVNLKTEEGKAALDRLLAKSDVFVSSYRTGALKRLGLDYESMHKRHPHIIWGQLNGFGDFGPAKDKPGFDVVAFWARSGAMMDMGEKGGGPINPPFAYGDAGSACSLAGGIAAALFRKSKTGEGCKVMISLFAQGIWNEGSIIASTQYGDQYPKTRKNALTPTFNSYQCSDGKWIYICILDPERYNRTLFQALGMDEIVDDPNFITGEGAKAHGPELIAKLDAAIGQHTQAEMVELLEKADIAHDCIRQIADAWKDPQALENKYIVPVDNLDGTTTLQAMTPIRFSLEEPKSIEDIEPTVIKHAPRIGEDSIEILTECGYSREEIDKMIADGVVACPEAK